MLRHEFFKVLKSSEYGQKYLKIIHNGRHSPCEERGEIHHIYPRSFEEGKIDSKDNLVKLSVYDHLLCHYYLARSIPNQHTYWAFRMMCDLHLGKLDPETREGIQQLEHCAMLRKMGRKKSEESIKRQVQLARGKIHINRDGKERKIYPKDLSRYLLEGWNKGRAGKVYNPSKGRVWIHKGAETTLVKKEELQQYIEEGWIKGRRKEETTRGKIRMIKDGQIRYATRDTFQQMLDEGYIKGAAEGRKGIIKDGKIKYVKPAQLHDFLKDGWILQTEQCSVK